MARLVPEVALKARRIMAKSDRPASSDSELFRQAVGPVRPVNDDRTSSRPAPPTPEPQQTRASEARVSDELLTMQDALFRVETGEEISHLKAGLQSRVLRRLRRGQYAVGGELDLHQLDEITARQVIKEFLQQAHEHRVNCVKIIHGKGLRSQDGPVLKNLVNAYLRRRSDVLAFTSARSNDGGTGSVYVLLDALP